MTMEERSGLSLFIMRKSVWSECEPYFIGILPIFMKAIHIKVNFNFSTRGRFCNIWKLRM